MRSLSWILLLLPGLVAPSFAQAPAPPQERLLKALRGARLPLTLVEGRPAGAGWRVFSRPASISPEKAEAA